MELLIKKIKTLGEIKAEFNKYFEYLKIEFCSKPHKIHEGTRKKFIYTIDKRISEINRKVVEKSIKIDPKMTVGLLEQIFATEIGLPIQVFRKSGPSWLETTSTDDWTLEKQNQYGNMLSSKILPDPITEFDNDAVK